MIRLHQLTILLFVLLLAACGGNSGGVPTATPTPVPSSTPPPIVQEDTYNNIPSGFTEQGFPTLGNENAPVKVVEYSSYDSGASQIAHDEIFSQLLARIEAGEIFYTFIPLSGTGSASNGAGAARAALCAGQQGAYWPFHDRLFALLKEQGNEAYSGENLLGIVDALGLNRDTWNQCALGDQTAGVLNAAAELALSDESYSGTPTILVNGNYVLNELYSINIMVDQILTRVDETGSVAALPTPEDPELNPETEATEELVVAPLTRQQVDPPIDIQLPSEWAVSMSDTLLLNDIDAMRTVPFTMYKGPVEGGIGSIVLLWGFPNTIPSTGVEIQMGIATPTPNLWADGLRLLRLAVIEQGCNIGTDLQRQYNLGSIQGTGTEWSAVDCPELPDTRGWFVGTQQDNINYLFYVYIEPIDPAGITPEERAARQQIQAILDTITFRSLNDTATGE